jgi:hypothetical protein
MTLACFMLRPTNTHRIFLRRYHTPPGVARDCTSPQEGKPSYHTAMTFVRLHDDSHGPVDLVVTDAMKLDPRWPTKCAQCDYVFPPDDHWQVFTDAVYINDLGMEFSLRDAPPGAMWHASWYDSIKSSRAPDGKNLVVVCPGGYQWWIDGPASNGPGWTRTGEPPLITCSPSIQTPNYHGWLQNGVFSDPC